MYVHIQDTSCTKIQNYLWLILTSGCEWPNHPHKHTILSSPKEIWFQFTITAMISTRKARKCLPCSFCLFQEKARINGGSCIITQGASSDTQQGCSCHHWGDRDDRSATTFIFLTRSKSSRVTSQQYSTIRSYVQLLASVNQLPQETLKK